MKNIAIVIPVYNEEGNIKELYEKLSSVAAGLKDFNFKFVLVDDGSSDNTYAIIRSLNQKDNRVKLIRFVQNCGSHAALSAGLVHADTDAAIVMAADLQDPPEVVASLIKKWQEGFKVVWAVREKREGESFGTQFFSRLYYFILNKSTNIKIPPSGADVFLIDRVTIEAFKLVPEKHTSALLTIAWLGFKPAYVPYVKGARHHGRSKWTLQKKCKLFLDSIFAFSTWPIKIIGFIGLLLLVVGVFVNLSILIKWFSGEYIRADMFLWGGDMLVASVQVLILWILGEYMYRTFDESRKRPKYIIEDKIL